MLDGTSQRDLVTAGAAPGWRALLCGGLATDRGQTIAGGKGSGTILLGPHERRRAGQPLTTENLMTSRHRRSIITENTRLQTTQGSNPSIVNPASNYPAP